jgi:hypothetical protein
MNKDQFASLSPEERINVIQSTTGMSRTQIVQKYPGISAPKGSRGLEQVWSSGLEKQLQSAGSTNVYKTDAEKAREDQSASERDAYDKTKALLEGLPQYQNALQGAEWEKAYGEAYGSGPMAAYQFMRDQLAAQKANEEQRLAASLQDELQGVDIGRAGQLANAYGALSMGGGLSSGARERIGATGLEQAMGQRQAQRLQNQRSVFDLGARTQEQMLGIGSQEAGKRMEMQQAITKAKIDEELRRQKFEQERADKMVQFEADQLKSQQAIQAAQASAPKGGK